MTNNIILIDIKNRNNIWVYPKDFRIRNNNIVIYNSFSRRYDSGFYFKQDLSPGKMVIKDWVSYKVIDLDLFDDKEKCWINLTYGEAKQKRDLEILKEKIEKEKKRLENCLSNKAENWLDKLYKWLGWK